MPILTTITHIRQILQDLPLPGTGGSVLQVVVTPPDPAVDQEGPYAYVWADKGPELRQSLSRPYQGTPRTGSTEAGWKCLDHVVNVWLVWFQDQDDPTPDDSFPIIVDAVMDAFRVAIDPAYNVQDPVTFRYSTLTAIGEKMEYEISPVRVVASQRLRRYDAIVTIHVNEEFQG